MKSGIKELNEEAYKSKLRCHSKFYKKKLIVDSTKIYNHYYSTVNNKSNEGSENNGSSESRKTLGTYRHFGVFCNYDQIIEMIAIKWEDKYPVFSRDLIHNLSSKVNDLIFDAIVNTKNNKSNKHEFNNNRKKYY